MRSILNKIAAFDVEEYEGLQKRGFPKNEVSEEQIKAFDEWIEERKEEAKAKKKKKMNEPIEEAPLPF